MADSASRPCTRQRHAQAHCTAPVDYRAGNTPCEDGVGGRCSLAFASQKNRQGSHKPLHMGILDPTEDPLAHRTKLGLLARAGGDLWISLTPPPRAGGKDTQIRSPTAQQQSPAPPRGRDLTCHRKASSGEQERNWLLRHQ